MACLSGDVAPLILLILISMFIARGHASEEHWQRVVLVLAVSVVTQKFFKRPKLAKKIIETESRILIEAADCDSQWGVLLKEGAETCRSGADGTSWARPS